MSNLYLTATAHALRLMEVEAENESIYEHTHEIDKHSSISWTTDIPSLHPSYLGLPSVEGRFHGGNTELQFSVMQTSDENGLRPIHLEIYRLPDPNPMMRLSFVIRDIDEKKDLNIFPMWPDSASFLSKETDSRNAVVTAIHYVMTVVFGFEYRKLEEDVPY